jgi:hypothetical protein
VLDELAVAVGAEVRLGVAGVDDEEHDLWGVLLVPAVDRKLAWRR